ncbi:poly-beta-1,6 N-acetyl-D-glucosamine export porin PgaA [Achromobacter ruhlandii]|uniref:Poly-beta-1,6-N-acetyl-D-glucosamine export protein n=1 Tax=Achromobacter ruhlandii TaxID=72557 RepID=A0A6S7E9R1_9BURK|nr:poly-beta-1,6 N-acetyl-D-glucosamine export porin PgaA [Achromobacter ruhlandii]CAB3902838.1 Poly-beta-1,6-N-acetyl-D-glucosamine export protein [Achromobacter ruhlandii]
MAQRPLTHAFSGAPRRRAAGARLQALTACALLAPALALAAPGADYDALIARARAGDYEPALAMLRQQGPAAGRQAVYDHIVIAGWAGRPAEAVAAYETLPAASAPPADIQLAVARAYRDLRRWPEALAAYRAGLRRHPGQSAFAAGEIMTLADAGQTEAARRAGQDWVAHAPRNVDARLALGYVHARLGQPYEALHQADKALAIAPGTPYVLREYIDALGRARLAQPALELARQHPDLFDARQLRRLEGDALAQQVRLASMPTRGEAERFVIADRALARYDELIPAWQALGDAARDDARRARIDRLHALHARARMTDVVREYEALRAEGVAVPRYALNDVASAYLYLRQPEKARDLYRQVGADDAFRNDDAQDRLSTETGLYYALAEAEQFDQTGAVTDAIGSGYAPWLYYKGQATRNPNDLKLESEQTVAAARLQADDTVAAEQRLAGMVANAPNNSTLRADLASVYRRRDQPRASERELKLAETLAPRALSVENGQGFTALDLQEWRQAEALSADTLERAPENLTSRRLAREWEVHNKAELRISGYRGLASDSPVNGNGDFGIDAVLYSPPIDYNWRAFGGGGYATGDFEEGRGNYRWLRAGVEWRGRDLTVEGEVSTHSYGHGVKPGLRLSAAYDIDDHWQVGGSGELLSRETPLRALTNDITANRLTGFVRWRANERREWTLSLSPSRFSDGNQRWELGLDGRERVYTAPHLKADLTLDLSTQRNSRDGAPYYNPRSDLMALPGARLTHTLYRRYETAWEQIGTVGAGSYTQQGYGTGGVIALGYGQRYRANDVLDMGAMVTGISRPYDGQHERELRIVFDLAYRF